MTVNFEALCIAFCVWLAQILLSVQMLRRLGVPSAGYSLVLKAFPSAMNPTTLTAVYQPPRPGPTLHLGLPRCQHQRCLACTWLWQSRLWEILFQAQDDLDASPHGANSTAFIAILSKRQSAH
ncbi:unnamed protein product [Aphanomyces euteiches]